VLSPSDILPSTAGETVSRSPSTYYFFFPQDSFFPLSPFSDFCCFFASLLSPCVAYPTREMFFFFFCLFRPNPFYRLPRLLFRLPHHIDSLQVDGHVFFVALFFFWQGFSSPDFAAERPGPPPPNRRLNFFCAGFRLSPPPGARAHFRAFFLPCSHGRRRSRCPKTSVSPFFWSGGAPLLVSPVESSSG